jgi:hypothetical protein
MKGYKFAPIAVLKFKRPPMSEFENSAIIEDDLVKRYYLIDNKNVAGIEQCARYYFHFLQS